MINSRMKYYVYELIDPRDSEVFYIGKGSGGRIDEHERQVLALLKNAKSARIAEIMLNGLSVDKRIIFETDNEDEAYAYERGQIVDADKAGNGLTNKITHFGKTRLISFRLSNEYRAKLEALVGRFGLPDRTAMLRRLIDNASENKEVSKGE